MQDYIHDKFDSFLVIGSSRVLVKKSIEFLGHLNRYSRFLMFLYCQGEWIFGVVLNKSEGIFKKYSNMRSFEKKYIYIYKGYKIEN